MRIDAIFCQASNGVIGKDGTLPWHLPEDLKFFKRITQGHPMIMGRKTWESLPGLLPGRPHFVITSQDPSKIRRPKKDPASLFRVFHNLTELKSELTKHSRAFLIGGSETFARLIDDCTGLYLTTLERPVEGDTSLDQASISQFNQLIWLEQRPGYMRSYAVRSSATNPRKSELKRPPQS